MVNITITFTKSRENVPSSPEPMGLAAYWIEQQRYRPPFDGRVGGHWDVKCSSGTLATVVATVLSGGPGELLCPISRVPRVE